MKIKTAPGGYTLRHRGVTVIALVATPRGASCTRRFRKSRSRHLKAHRFAYAGRVISIDVKPARSEVR